MPNFMERNEILRNIIRDHVEFNPTNLTDKKEILDYYIKPLREGNFDVTPYLPQKNVWDKKSLCWDVITFVLKKYDAKKLCPFCYEEEGDFVDYVERVTMPDVMVVKCKNGHQYGY